MYFVTVFLFWFADLGFSFSDSFKFSIFQLLQFYPCKTKASIYWGSDPNVPVKSLWSFVLTLAKVEKYVAELLSSQPNMATIFILSSIPSKRRGICSLLIYKTLSFKSVIYLHTDWTYFLTMTEPTKLSLLDATLFPIWNSLEYF